MDKDLFYLSDPAPARLIVLLSCCLLAIVIIYLGYPLYALPPLCVAGVFIFMTVRHPEQFFALQQDKITRENYARYNRFIDALIAGKIIDDDTIPEQLVIFEPSPFVYTVEMHQPGKTFDMLQRACENSLNSMEALAVSVKQDSASNYTVRYSALDPKQVLAEMPVPFRELLDPDISLSHLPIGKFEDGTPVYVNLESRNMIGNGNPRSGKSVMLSCLLAGLCRANLNHPVNIAVMSPKILDFQEFEDGVRLISDVDEMLDFLEKIHAEAQRRKQFCIANRIKKIEPKHYAQCPPIVIVIDEFTVIKTTTQEDDKGRAVRIGEQIENAVMRLVAETGFAAISFVLCTQRVSSQNMRTDLRDLIAGCRVSFATETPETDRMIFGDYAEYAPCHEIATTQKGVGYISIDGVKPVPFKGAFADATDERDAAEIAYQKRIERKQRKKVRHG